jgi:hypothetical protein
LTSASGAMTMLHGHNEYCSLSCGWTCCIRTKIEELWKTPLYVPSINLLQPKRSFQIRANINFMYQVFSFSFIFANSIKRTMMKI